MSKEPLQKPTASELEILRVLWARGPSTVREVHEALGWTLLHFVWQGAALAALFAVANTLCRQATTRYALAVIALVLMMAAPVVTFTRLMRQKDPAVRYGAPGAFALAGKPVQGVSVTARPSAPAPEIPDR